MHDLFGIEFLTFKLTFISLMKIHFNELKRSNFFFTKK